VAQEERRRGSWRPRKTPVMAVGGAAENGEGKQEEDDEDLFINFAKVQGVHCKVKFSSKL
jgi:hypothetical protein